MIKITKSKEPIAWKRIRTTPGVTYEDAPKDELRLSLFNEQGGLCAYCMRSINITPGVPTTTRIEHIKPRKLSIKEGRVEETLSYDNMILCCDGDIDGSGCFHCDRSKEDQTISFSPLDQAVIDTISYSSKVGTIKSSNPKYNKEFNEVLNLNHPRIEASRLAVIKGLIIEIGKKKWKKKDLIDKLQYYSGYAANGQLHEYCGVVIWYLKKKLRQLV